jgi:cell shape-determining protein MreC
MNRLTLTEEDLEKAEDRADISDTKAEELEEEVTRLCSELKSVQLNHDQVSPSRSISIHPHPTTTSRTRTPLVDTLEESVS